MTSPRWMLGAWSVTLLMACPLPPKSAGENDDSPTSDSGINSAPTGAMTPGGSADSTMGLDPTATSSGTGPQPSTTSSDEPGYTCRDAIDCTVGCVAAMIEDQDPPELDLTCIQECQEGLAVDEALSLTYLTECVTNRCIEIGLCEALEPRGSGSGESGTDSSTGGSGSSGEAPPQQCIDCIMAHLLDVSPGGECQQLADQCI